ncbi:hypothetical protein HXA34_07640 [Salipaludibacillus agaradhaerens]|uniref:hypothetical protein n=1 Tax=Salipaludibacillus agaradhaerens TaxID=76935 RepID=UPI002151482C|nr:hypothetical protein [Salipaludibacillus agaradhaerens]MCR6106151.1 hypothetical protein [Salipaludibacillus agaradhaerens]MCR6118184.1 hypothetical protein [Salipaludibacillus agaradhaerens]
MRYISLKDMTCSEFKDELVKLVMTKLEEHKEISPLIAFPIVHERVEAFVLAHWQEAWEQCHDLTWKEWLKSPCYQTFKVEVLNDILSKNHLVELVAPTEDASMIEYST